MQVQCLETTKQRLEHQIQEVLDKKYPYPKELEEMDRHLKAVSVLQEQASKLMMQFILQYNKTRMKFEPNEASGHSAGKRMMEN